MTKKLDPIEARLKRVEGQIKAIYTMYETQKSCEEVVQQLLAARAALGKIASLLVSDEMKDCAKCGDVKRLEKIIDTTLKSL